MAQLKPGDKAPDIKLADQQGKTVKLSDYKGRKVLVYFYPKADTPGCTAQACSLRDAYTDLLQEGVTVIGVSHDPPEAQKKFQEKYRLPFALIADTDGAVARAFQVPTVVGFTKRQAFLIRDGKIVWADFSASTDKQADDVKKAIRAMLPKS